ncbi:UvrD-helicase domain-containing protein [Pedobacter aquatilis]|uniref:UvrD-helicase domain-containing protein n=1 Tax=Pedobacter aquatilis TaxID=351343 RepID=UPI00292EFD5C|nr:UvrD-helicase domain-containing protein [Pedobacter aquatilis]
MKIGDLTIGLQILLFILSFGILYFFKQRQAELEKRAKIRNLIPNILTAIDEFRKTQGLVLYFSKRDAAKLSATQSELLNAIPKNYQKCGLNDKEISSIAEFVSYHQNLEMIREGYNKRFIIHEIKEFKDFMAQLDTYPLSDEQMRAVVCDEDNNLVIAGAGTGKTTTISAKIAYILEKNLARPEELLVISFTNSAVEEMFDRTCNFLKDDEMARHITFKTFNSFGNMVTRYCNPQPKKIAFDGKDYRAKSFLQEAFDRLFIQDSDFQQKAINFIAFFSRPPRDEFQFKTESDYVKHEQSFRNFTLNGLECKSMEEVMVANFLYLHQVEFEYESFYPMDAADRNPDFGHYQPDFYLPDYGLYHEHYGIDENGNVPDYFGFKPPFRSATEQYHSGMQWKTNIHKKYQTRLIKTYSFQNRKSTLLKALKIQLEENGVALNKRPPGEILSKVKNLDDYEDFMGLVYTFLNLMKSNNASVEQLKAKAKDQRFKVFLGVFAPLYQAYQIELKRTKSIDYNDMVNLASSHIGKGEFKKVYKYILVDEFQDMSLGRYNLLKALKSANSEAKLYAVGDDWQSIFRFTGSDISIITEFSKHFGATAENGVLQTYRFNDEILDLSSGFIQSNPAQLKKRLSSPYKSTLPAFELVPLSTFGNKTHRALQKFDCLNALIKKIAQNHSKGTIFLIGRYHHNAPPDLRELQRANPNLKIAYHTAHACKGLTCDVSILLDLNAGVFGFPSEMADDPILSNLLHEGETFENAEERRLFYVALTRARHQVYLLHTPHNQSKFLKEIIEKYGINVGIN